MQGGMVGYLALLAEAIDEACREPGELATVRKKDQSLEKASGTTDTINWSSEQLAAALRRDMQASSLENATPELAAVARLFL